MLRVQEDDPGSQRLVLQAPAPGRGFLVRQVLATAIAALPTVGVLAVLVLWPRQFLWHVVWLLVPGVFATWTVAERFAPQLVELGFDGAARQLWWVERGHLIWRTRRRTQALAERDGLAFRAGVLTGCAQELGVVLELAGRPATPTFVIDRVASRLDLERLVDRVANRIGRRVLRQRNDIDGLRLFCGAEGATPSAREGGSYRVAGSEPPLELGQHAGFEAPSILPAPLLPGESHVLADALAATGPTELTVTRTAPPFRYGPWLLAGGFSLTLAGFALVADAPPVSRLPWIEAMAVSGLLAFVVGIRSYGVVLADDTWHALARALRPVFGPPRLSPPVFGVPRVVRAALRAKQLDLALTRSSVQLMRADLVLVRHERRRAEKGPDPQVLALWVLASSRWYSLAETRTGDLEGPGAAALRRVAFDVASALDAPLRVA